MRYQLYKDRSLLWRWRLKVANGHIISDSGEGYYNKADAMRGIEINKNSGGAPIDET